MISLGVSSCGDYRGHIEPRAAQACAQHMATQRGTWRPRESLRNVDNTAIRRARSPWRPCGNVAADVQGCPRGVAPLRHPLALRDHPVAHTGGATTPSPHHATGGAPHPSVLFAPPGHRFSTLDIRYKLLI